MPRGKFIILFLQSSMLITQSLTFLNLIDQQSLRFLNSFTQRIYFILLDRSILSKFGIAYPRVTFISRSIRIIVGILRRGYLSLGDEAVSWRFIFTALVGEE